MPKRSLPTLAAAGLLLAAPAWAQVAATAATDLNLRSGPGPEQEIVGLIPANEAVSVEGCLDDDSWCRVDYAGTLGWASGEYLNATIPDQPDPVPLYENRTTLQVGSVTFDRGQDAATGAGALGGAALAAALVGGPAALVAGAAIGAATGAAVAPDDATVTYIRENPVDPVYLQGEVIVGAGIPEEVDVLPVPETEFGYLYVNGVPVVVDPSNRQIVYIVR